jgi:TetR/AcrR family transcriptional regulator, regulator of cefoperazone and chloramphenicol sensitivity
MREGGSNSWKLFRAKSFERFLLLAPRNSSVSDVESTKQRIVESAAAVFAERGFRAATVREICQRAGANVAAVNYHFGDKQRLYIESVKLAHCNRSQAFPLPERLGERPPAARLRAVIETMLERMLRSEGADWAMQLMLREISQPSLATEELVREFIRPHFELLLATVRELVPSGADETYLHRVVFSIVGQCLYYRVAGPVVRLLISGEEYARYDPPRLAQHITEFTLAALRSASPQTSSASPAAARSS